MISSEDEHQTYREQASSYWQQKNWQELVAVCQQAIEIEPEDYYYYSLLAQGLAHLGQWQQAIAAWQQVIQLQPDHREAYHHLGDAWINLQHSDEAVVAYQQAIQLNPDFAWSYLNLGIAYFNLDRLQAAIESYHQSLAIDGNNPECYYRLGQVLASLGRWEEARNAYQQGAEVKSDRWQLYHEWGDSLVNLKLFDEAVGAYQQAIKLNPNFAWSYYNLGLALVKLQLWQEATPFFRQAVDIDPNFSLAYVSLGEVLAHQQQWDEVVSVYQQAFLLGNNLPDLQFKLAQALHHRAEQDLVTALSYYQEILSQPQVSSEIYLAIAKILAQQYRLSEAIFYCYLALKIEPNSDFISALLVKLRRRRSKLYEVKQDFAVADYNYSLWRKSYAPNLDDLCRMSLQVTELDYQPLISIILLENNFTDDFLPQLIESIQAQVYPHWELWITVDQKDNLNNSSHQDSRIHLQVGEQNDLATCANLAVEQSQGDILALLQPATLLTPNALAEVVFSLNKNKVVDVIYGDEDYINQHNLLTQPWFKPDWCPDAFLSHNYFGSVVFIRRSLIKILGGFKPEYGSNCDYDLLLRITEKTNKIVHLSQIISHHLAYQQNLEQKSRIEQVLTDTLKRRKQQGQIIKVDILARDQLQSPELYTIRYQIKDYALVSIIIPTRNFGAMLAECLTSIFELTTYPNYEVIVIDNGSDEPQTTEVINYWQNHQPAKFRCLPLDIPFNYSRLNNYAANQAQGKYLLFLNNDTKVITPDWLEGMVAQAQRYTIGAVGALLLYPDRTVQHAGVVLGITGIAGHSHRHFPADSPGYYYRLQTVHNTTAVTGACLMCRREVFEKVGGFNEQLAVAYNDVDLCLKMRQQGYHNLWLPYVQLYHYESQSRSLTDTSEQIQQEVRYMQQTWGELLTHDPCYNIHLTRDKEDYSLNLRSPLEVTAVRLTENEDNKLWGCFLDSPQPGYLQGDSLDVIGWVIGKIAPAIAIQVIYNNKIIAQTDIDLHRPDVAQVYPYLPEAGKSGFATTVQLKDLSSYTQLNLQAVLADQTSVPLAKVQLRY